MASKMASVLRQLKLEHFIERFDTEKITPDLVGKLSLNEFKELGVQNRNDIMALRIECTKYGSERGMREMSVDLLNLIFQDVFWGVTLIKTLRLTRSRRFSQCQRAQFIGG